MGPRVSGALGYGGGSGYGAAVYRGGGQDRRGLRVGDHRVWGS